jgi:hypothetical protein
MNSYKLQIQCVVLSVDIQEKKQFILSLKPNEIIFPTLECDDSFFTDQQDNIINFIRKYIFLNKIELLPQIICLDKKQDENTINVTYGFLVTKTHSINDCSWFEFKYEEPNPHSHLLFKVTQALK